MSTDFRAKIRKASDPINVENIIVTIFGDPGMGKTSISMTADSPLHLDYDEGVERAVGRKDSMRIESWQDGIDLLTSSYIEDEKIKTLVIDTVGTALDNFCARFVIDENPKNGKAGGGLAIGGYGAMKDKFAFFKMLATAKKVDIVLLCHSGDEKDDEKTKKVPKITGGSYDIVKQSSDLIGFMESRGNKRTLDFNSTDRHDGKNCPNFPMFTLPHYTDASWSTYLSEIIRKTKDHMNRMSEDQKKAMDVLNSLRDKLKGITTFDELGKFNVEIESLAKPLKMQLEKNIDDVFVNLWANQKFESLKSPVDFDNIVLEINALETKYQIPIKKKLLEYSKTIHITMEKGDKGFKLMPTHPDYDNQDFPDTTDLTPPVAKTETNAEPVAEKK